MQATVGTRHSPLSSENHSVAGETDSKGSDRHDEATTESWPEHRENYPAPSCCSTVHPGRRVTPGLARPLKAV